MTIAITSGKGGTGKTTAVAAIGSCLAALGKKTVCIDMDLVLRNLDLALGIQDLTIWDMADVASGRCKLAEAVTPHPKIPNLYLLMGPSPESGAVFTKEDLGKVIAQIKDEFDDCLIDAPAGLGEGFQLSVAFADMVIVLCTTDSTSLRDSQKTVMELGAMGVENTSLVVNRVQTGILKRTFADIDDVMDYIGVPILGVVPEDKDVLIASGQGRALVLSSHGKAAKTFLRIAQRLGGERVPLKYK